MMPNQWRPDGWKPNKNCRTLCFNEGNGIYRKVTDVKEAYEAGADAMLEALAEEAGKKKVWFDRSDGGTILIYVELFKSEIDADSD